MSKLTCSMTKWKSEISLIRGILNNIIMNYDPENHNSCERRLTSLRLSELDDSKLLEELFKMDDPEDFLKISIT